jgi:hypothetical protein
LQIVASRRSRLPVCLAAARPNRAYAGTMKIGWRDGFRAIYAIVKYNLFR